MKKWMMLTAALALGVSATAADAAGKLKACWVYVGPVGDSLYYAVLISISRSYPPLEGRLHTRYAPVRRSHIYC